MIRLSEVLAARDFAEKEAAAAAARTVAAQAFSEALLRVSPGMGAVTAVEILQLAAQYLAAERGYGAEDISELAAFAARATECRA